MTKVNKNFSDIPDILKNETRENIFNANIKAGKYIDKSNLYKTSSVQKELTKIYYFKCAYCEKKLLDTDLHIEHYRPKSVYYWLAYSWDNLLLSCGQCNRKKRNNFKIENSMAIYNNEEFSNIHNLSESYNKIEKPYAINPEKEDVFDKLIYDENAIIKSSDKRVLYTINDLCGLNRNELIEKRIQLITDFKNVVEDYFYSFSQDSDEDIKSNIKFFIPLVKDFVSKVTLESEFYTFRRFIIMNIDVFFDNEDIKKILKVLISKLSNA
ncbi:TIGR02646 family protein [Malaciobacter halophilus]|uniref:TIGR02646 family protein n=1 Tax=Malaciobacter halophilus TaxID=197482 RepID=A0A2N1J293_9BACT|nr:retron system putative HNH endonuclease [Malaciobacter halophilus]AXH09327.1 HNH endonuclease [Malaciobacter halophilus]PKI80683.1 TIGR02646 family protein [Malaciobacter halophilus]